MGKRGHRGSSGRGRRDNFRGKNKHHNRSRDFNNRSRDFSNRSKDSKNKPQENLSLYQPEQLREIEVGITEYISSLAGFTAVIKGRYSDFHVSEIDLDGNVAKLTDTQVPKNFVILKTEPPVESPTKEISEEKWKEITEMMTNKDETCIVEIECQEKDRRNTIHKTLKEIYNTKINSNTIDKDGKKVIQIQQSFGKNIDPRNSEWPSQIPLYTHFILYKESIDTMNAIMNISSQLRINSAAFNYAGVKDKRAKTSQWISCKKLNPSRLIYGCKHIKNIKLGNITFKDGPLKLGNLDGNLFRIALREITADDDIINKHLEHLKEHGFINYYGLQRFGNDKSVPTYQIGVALLQGKFNEACNLILKVKQNDNPDHEINQAKMIYYETKDAVGASKKLTSDHFIESKLIFGLAKSGKNNFVSALESIPRNMRLMYLHSFQSYIWNLVVSKRIKDFGMKPIVGDLVFVKEGDEIEDLLYDFKDGDTSEEVDIKSEVKILNESDLDNYTIYDIVLPLPGYNITYPNNSLKDYYKELLGKYNLELEMPMQRVKCYTLSGNYRKIIALPKDLTWRTIRYNEPTTVLILSDFEEILKHKEPVDDPNGKFKGLVVSFKLKSSCYATMVLREILKIDTSAQNQSKLSAPVCNIPESVPETLKTPPVEEKPQGVEGSLLHDKTKFEAFKKLLEETDGEEYIPVQRQTIEEVAAKKQKLNEDDEGIKIEPSLI